MPFKRQADMTPAELQEYWDRKAREKAKRDKEKYDKANPPPVKLTKQQIDAQRQREYRERKKVKDELITTATALGLDTSALPEPAKPLSKDKVKPDNQRGKRPLPTSAEILLARNNYKAFVSAVYLNPNALQWKWFHSHIAMLLDSLAKAVRYAVEGQNENDKSKIAQSRKLIRRLSLSIPCQHGKSELGSVYLIPYLFGICPDARVIFGAATVKDAMKWSRKIQKIMNTPAYLAIFPDTRLGDGGKQVKGVDVVKKTESEFEIVGRQGSFLGVGVGSAVSGNTADLWIIDDPIANVESAHSVTDREKHWEWFNEDVTSRGHNDYCILLVASRRHPEDLQGKVREEAEKHPDINNPWEFVVIRALKELGDKEYPGDGRKLGEALWPEKHDLGRLEAIRNAKPWNFQSQYQQDPLPDGGVIFHASDFRHWAMIPDADGEWLSSWDCASSNGNDGDRHSYTVGQIWFRPWSQGKIYLVQQIRSQMRMNELLSEFRRLEKQYPKCRRHLIESGGFGRGVAQYLGDNGVLGVEIINPTKSKAIRALEIIPYINAGNVYIPPDDDRYPWVATYLIRLCRFTGAKNEENDEVDATTQALSHFGPVYSQHFEYQSGAKRESSKVLSLF